ncbi:hypothetical protein ACFOWU_08170 [Epilithonimonas zeae]|uniref:Uncharacterized protein n=1 Tax=Epilithonimonas zeae TaxID=1416779 RepID=A0A1N6G8C5_9FLAO|nr:hypothetical protein [Epilithonimonas zeae]SIO03809.1 hypothetical protein SAMN05444409_1709 [Epilithonimonas zeae]
MSFQTDPKKILGFWENINFPPFAYNDEKIITLNLKDEQHLSMITIKKGQEISNYVLRFSRFDFNMIDKLTIFFTLENGDNIDFSRIGEEIFIDCSGYFTSENIKDNIICECELFERRLFQKYDNN